MTSYCLPNARPAPRVAQTTWSPELAARPCRMIGWCRMTNRHEAIRKGDPALREVFEKLARVRRRLVSSGINRKFDVRRLCSLRAEISADLNQYRFSINKGSQPH